MNNVIQQPLGGRSLRILMIAPQPFFTPRGTPFSVLHRIRALVEHGHKVDLITYPIGEDIEFDGLRIIRSASIPFIKKIKIGPSIPKLFLDVPLYFASIRALKNNTYDVLHSHEEAAFFAVGLARRYGIPHIYDMHSSLPQQLSNFNSFNFGPVRWLFESLEKRVLTSCDGVITICDDLARVVESICPEKPHKMIENIGDDRKVFSPANENLEAQLQLKGNKVLLYTGTFEAYQGLDLLLNSMVMVKRNNSEAVLVMVGGQPEQVEAYKNMAVDLGINDVVRFTGMVHPSKIPGFIDLADVIVSPRSRGTNTPLKIYGYMRTNVPIVATDRFTHTQILSHDTAVLVAADSDSFAGGICRVLDDEGYATQVAGAAKTFADENFSDDKYIEMVTGLYYRVLEPLLAESIDSMNTTV